MLPSSPSAISASSGTSTRWCPSWWPPSRRGEAIAGYSGTPLARKLGIKAGSRLSLIDAPDGFGDVLGDLPDRVAQVGPRTGGVDVIVLFSDDAARLRRRVPAQARRLAPSGGLWIAWPKQSSGVATDLRDGVVRAIGLEQSLVDNKVCAIDDTWSGLRFVMRREDRQ